MKKGLITQGNILSAAEEIFSQKGLYGARIDEIAEAAGCNKRMIYAHFGSKEGLYTAVLKHVYSRLSVTEEVLAEESLSAEGAVRLYIRMVMWENLNEAKYMKDSGAANIKNASVRFLEKVLKQGVEEGVFKKDINPKEIIISINLYCFSCFSNVYTMTHIMNIDFFNPEEMELRIDTVTKMILNYIIK